MGLSHSKGKLSDVDTYQGGVTLDDEPVFMTCQSCLLEKCDVTLLTPYDALKHFGAHARKNHLIPTRLIETTRFYLELDTLYHFGLFPDRLQGTSKSAQRETAFAVEWATEATQRPAIDDGTGTLQGIMFDTKRKRYVYEITQRDATIVATVIQ